MPLAYGYVRWSSDIQETGDSLARQTAAILDWIKRHKATVQLDTSLGERGFFVDRGMSGFQLTGENRKNLDDYQLGEFMRLAERGRIQPGSILIVESADRISRESAVVAINLFTRLLMLGVVVVTLTPEMEYKTDADIGKLITVGVTIDRAHDESRMKHKRGTNAWVSKRAAAKSQPMTSLLPGWCRLVGARKVGTRLVGGEIKPDAAKVATVRRLFSLARSGIGCPMIARKLNGEGVPNVGRGRAWTQSAVHNILTSRAVLGEYIPHTGRMGNRKKGKTHTRKPTGEIIEGYYPPIIDRDEFYGAQAALQQRSSYKGRNGNHTNLFTGLLFDALDSNGGKFSYRHSTTHPPTLIPVAVKDGSSDRAWTSFNAGIFDDAILSQLAELKAADILPDSDHGGKVARLSALYAEKESELREFRDEINTDPKLLKTLRATLIRLETEREKLAEELADAQREAASPLAEALGQVQGVTELVKDGPEEMRLRCRAALRRLIEGVYCVFTGTKIVRFAAVRIQFRGSDRHRDYLIVYHARTGTVRNPPPPTVESLADAGLPGDLDLRKPDHARRMEKALKRALAG